MRELEGDKSYPVDRSMLRLVQTPQCFRSDLLRRGFELTYDEAFTDEASLMERLDVAVYLIEGEERNIKVTTPLDLKVAELLV